jgi:hypothetical protein
VVHQLPGALPGPAPVAADEDEIDGVGDEPGAVIAQLGEKQLPDVGIDLASHPAHQRGRAGLEVGHRCGVADVADRQGADHAGVPAAVHAPVDDQAVVGAPRRPAVVAAAVDVLAGQAGGLAHPGWVQA